MASENDGYKPFGIRVLEASELVHDLAEEADETHQHAVVRASLKLHSQQLEALASAFPEVSEDDGNIDWEEQRSNNGRNERP